MALFARLVPVWVYNTVLVPKRNREWWTWHDFTDLNKA